MKKWQICVIAILSVLVVMFAVGFAVSLHLLLNQPICISSERRARDLAHEQQLTDYISVIENSNSTESEIEQAKADKAALEKIIEKEEACEQLLIAHEFDDCLVILTENDAKVIIGTYKDLTEDKTAIIYTIIQQQYGLEISNIKILQTLPERTQPLQPPKEPEIEVSYPTDEGKKLRDVERANQISAYDEIILSSDSSADEVAKAKADKENLQKIIDKEKVIDSLLNDCKFGGFYVKIEESGIMVFASRHIGVNDKAQIMTIIYEQTGVEIEKINIVVVTETNR